MTRSSRELEATSFRFETLYFVSIPPNYIVVHIARACVCVCVCVLVYLASLARWRDCDPTLNQFEQANIRFEFRV